MPDLTLEIHHVNVGTGDATVIVVRDYDEVATTLSKAGVAPLPVKHEMLQYAIENNHVLDDTIACAVLIDAGNDAKKAARIKAYLSTIGVTELNYVLTSHYHQDHLGGYPNLLKRVNSAAGSEAYDAGDHSPKPANIFPRYRAILASKNYSLNKVPATGNDIDTQFDLVPGMVPAMTLTCIATDTAVLDGTNHARARNNNDFGMAWLLQYGAFRYLTGGDLGGFDAGGYIDMETPMIEAVVQEDAADFETMTAPPMPLEKGHVCACKLNHHGSEHSSNGYYLSIMKPKSAVISAGDKKYGNDHHPHEEVIEELEAATWDVSSWKNQPPNTSIVPNSLQHYYLTGILGNLGVHRDNIGMPGSRGSIGGDVVIIVDNTNIASESSYAVYWNGEKPGDVVSHNADMKDTRPAGVEVYHCHRATAPVRYIT